jgi:hypothetical protein
MQLARREHGSCLRKVFDAILDGKNPLLTGCLKLPF